MGFSSRSCGIRVNAFAVNYTSKFSLLSTEPDISDLLWRTFMAVKTENGVTTLTPTAWKWFAGAAASFFLVPGFGFILAVFFCSDRSGRPAEVGADARRDHDPKLVVRKIVSLGRYWRLQNAQNQVGRHYRSKHGLVYARKQRRHRDGEGC